MRHLLPVFLLIAGLGTTVLPTQAAGDLPDDAFIMVQVTGDGLPLAGAMVAVDLNNNGIWDEHLGEPRDVTDDEGVVVFSSTVAIDDPGAVDPPGGADWQPVRIMTGNVRGAVGAAHVQFDYVLPPGPGQVSLELYDLRGRRVARTRGNADLELRLPGGLPAGPYLLRLAAEPAAPVSQRITSVAARTRTIRANRVSAAAARGWADVNLPAGDRSKRDFDLPAPINLIVEHEDHVPVIQPEVLEQGYNQFAVEMGPSIPAGFVHVAPGSFLMGTPNHQHGWQENETAHAVTLTRGFYMAQHEVTEAWWHEVMGGTPTNPDLPKRQVSWDMAVAFCNALSLQEGWTPAYEIHGLNGNVTWNRDADGYRLPTEVEWEYACRSGSYTAFANGPLLSDGCVPQDAYLIVMGWYCGNRTYHQGPAAVGLKQPNAWGLYDMHGNVAEWVWDGYRDDYENLDPVDPVHDVAPGTPRVLRGGFWYWHAVVCRSAKRDPGAPDIAYGQLGLRPVRTAVAHP